MSLEDGRPICTHARIVGFGVQEKCFYPAFVNGLCSYHILLIETLPSQEELA